ncbi:non-heme iron oxygenase ferredoxin subunit [Luedemannella flava]|uniref:Non-heme iron oxygenase ferredoxin subunit n=1 Tax=Luedemannella flava TaxID=349316 RepID=A0ABN2LKG0_9ACTN
MSELTFVRACAAADVAVGHAVPIDLDGTEIAVVHAEDGNFYAVYDECSHQSVPLSEGEVDGCTLECWLHGSRFDLRTGEPSGLPATEPVPVYPVEVRDGDIYVSLTPSNGVVAP